MPSESKKIYTPYSPSPEETVRRAVELAEVGPKSVVYDVGAGDGRFAVEAAKRGAKAVAVEYNPWFEKLIDCRCQAAGVVVEKLFCDAALVDYSPATHIFLTVKGDPEVDRKVTTQAQPGARIITLGWSLDGVGEPRKEEVTYLGYRYYLQLAIRNFEDVQSLYPLTVQELVEKMPSYLKYEWAGPFSGSVWIYRKEGLSEEESI